MKSSELIGVAIFSLFLGINGNSLGYLDEDCPIILSRSQWRAQKANFVYYQTIPVDKIVIIGLEETCRASFECRSVVKRLQKDHISKFRLPDIAFNFLIDDNGFIYEGTGWLKSGSHTTGHNRNSLGIAFIGTTNSDTVPSEEAMHVFQELIDCGIRGGKISEDYKVFAHRQLCYQSNNPSYSFFEIIKKLPHWSSD
ncbi:peptidoglycan-recognition protein SA-like isoform X2 [Phlebotomus argentipes]|uniref:peptidoglycan-recognition protein SA-like isoform X2 n=1 Tax=Phlebotomus argentipes TaxID=94469 RepID=UPI0028931E2A|nr:peptidoglycan-recognition protein SA-like isoform X2 [Phlebotomus argentipes]